MIKSSSKQKLQVCKQQQRASGNKNFVNGVCAYAYKLVLVGPLTMKLGTLIYHDKPFIETEITITTNSLRKNGVSA